jgi:GT2 family glycosyltransferase
LLNDDVEVISPGWLTEMVSNAIRPDIGCVGAKLIYPNGTIQHAGVICGIGGIAGHSHKHVSAKSVGYILRLVLPQNISAVTGACLAVRREIWEEVGGLNEHSLPVAYNDVDFCLRVREAGYRNLWTPYATLYHHESASRGLDDPDRNRDRSVRERAYMKQKWKRYLDRDPYYNPHLTLDKEDFSFSDELKKAAGSKNGSETVFR